MRIYPYKFKGSLRVTDEDAPDFLQSQFSNDLRPFDEGRATYGLWLDVKGKVIADSWIVCLGEEEFLVLSEHSETKAIQDKLEQHIIADDVELEPVGPLYAVSIIGEGAVKYLETFDGPAGFVGRRSAEDSVELVFDSEAERDAYVEGSTLERLSEAALHAQRIEAGYPLIPAEIGTSDLPGEGGLEKGAISFTKGCFLGQEVIARMHNLGKATRSLYKLSGEGALPAVPLSLVNVDGKSVGELRSAYLTDNGWFGVALIKLRYVEECLSLESGGGSIQLEGALSSKGSNE